jgi:outer membrane receptor protein involved in Fe transport
VNAQGLWWYGDRRIDPTEYASPHALRVDLAASATMKDVTLTLQLQNVAGFPYRTAAGYPFAGRTLRFGIDWKFRD